MIKQKISTRAALTEHQEICCTAAQSFHTCSPQSEVSSEVLYPDSSAPGVPWDVSEIVLYPFSDLYWLSTQQETAASHWSCSACHRAFPSCKVPWTWLGIMAHICRKCFREIMGPKFTIFPWYTWTPTSAKFNDKNSPPRIIKRLLHLDLVQ